MEIVSNQVLSDNIIRAKKFSIEIYGIDVNVVLCNDIKSAITEMTGVEDNVGVSPVATIASNIKQGGNVVWMFFTSDRVKISDINHEVLHVTVAILEAIHLKLSTETDEAFAYLSGFIFEQVLIMIREEVGIALLWR